MTRPDDWDWWWGAWKGRIRCSCRALIEGFACPVCGADYRNVKPVVLEIDGKTVSVPQAFQGALDWSHYVMLQLMHQEWLRPAEPAWTSLPQEKRPSPRILVVLLFWTYFEAMMAWFYETAMSELPKAVAEDLLNRYGFIGARIGRLHRVLFGRSYGDDLDTLGFGPVRLHLENVQRQRNAFVHGDPQAVNDLLVKDTVNMFPEFQRAWIASFNFRCAKQPT